MQVVICAHKHDRSDSYRSASEPLWHGLGLHLVQNCSTSLITSGQNNDFDVIIRSEFAIFMIFVFLISALS